MQGDWHWHELATPDTKKAADFYGQLLGWKTKDVEMGGGQLYTLILQGGRPEGAGGMMQFQQPGVPPHWLIYVEVDDIDAAADRIPKLGGKVLHGPITVETVGRFAVVADPQGAVIGLITPAR